MNGKRRFFLEMIVGVESRILNICLAVYPYNTVMLM